MAGSRKEKFDREAFHSSIRKKDFAPVYFFYGEEDFLIQECVDEILKSAVDPSMKEFNFDVLQGTETDGAALLGIVSSYPMMSDRRVVVVKSFDKMSGKEMLEPYFDNPVPTTLLILTAANPDMRKKPFNQIRSKSVAGEFKPLYDNETIAWIEARMKKLNQPIETPAVALLQSYVGNSLRDLANEIEKLMIASRGSKAITAGDVEAIVGVSKEFSVFELANKVGEKNLSKSIEIATRLLESGGSAIPIIAALTSHFIRLWKISDGIKQRKSESEIASMAGIHPFFVRASIEQCKNFTSLELENSFVLLAEADLTLKLSGDAHLVLTDVLTRIIHSRYDQTAVIDA